ncbi:hypothetical protein OF375_02170 [Ureaplasma miroungigenitalium]|uniref:hypothetical protein n=1 Tax=Ureaplasma miroungigenitalium TaxID=1042321 RepID=UPI0021E83D8F|nr:hypothetical protein [Ureaplasma miroungigenitalium]MCV3734372.1 hypothetical protein [Ureaplasma miroungigenitalium]
MKKKTRLVSAITLGLGALSLICIPAVACTNSKQKNTVNLSERFSYDDYIIQAPNRYDDSQFNFKQEDKEARPYLGRNLEKSLFYKEQNKDFYQYNLIYDGSFGPQFKRTINLNDHLFQSWYERLTINSLKKDIQAYIYRLFNRYNTLKDDFIFGASEIKISAKRDEQALNPNQTVITYDDKVDINELNKNVKFDISFDIYLTNRTNGDLIVKDLFENDVQAIPKNSCLIVHYNTKDARMFLDFYRDQKYEQLSSFENEELKNNFRLGYNFENMHITSELQQVRVGAKKDEADLLKTSVGPYDFVWKHTNNYPLWTSYVLNKSLKNVTYKNNIFNMYDQLSDYLKPLSQNEVVKDIADNFLQHQAMVKTTANNVFDILNAVYNDKRLVDLFRDNSEAFYQLVLNTTNSPTIANIVRAFSANRSLGAVLETIKPVLKTLLDLLIKDNNSIKKIIFEKFMSINFANNLINEVGQFQTLVNSLDLKEIVPFKNLINAVFQEVILSEKKAKAKDDGSYGIINFFDDIVSLILSVPEDQIPEVNIGTDNNLAKLLNQVRELLNVFVPVDNNLDAPRYLISEFKILDLISLNKDQQVDYKEGIKKIFELLKVFDIFIPENIMKILNDFLINNPQWTKANIQQLLRAILYLQTNPNNDQTTITLKDFVNNCIKIEYDPQQTVIDYDSESQTLKNLKINYKYIIQQDVYFNLENIYQLLPKTHPDYQKLLDIVQKELPRQIQLITGDYVNHLISVKTPQKLIPLIYKELETNKYSLGYYFYPEHTIDVCMTQTMNKFLDNNQYSDQAILSKQYLAPLLSLLFYRQWTFNQPFTVYSINSSTNLKKINDEHQKGWIDFNEKAYDDEFSFNAKLPKTTNQDHFKAQLLADINTQVLDKITLTDDLDRTLNLYKTNDTLSLDPNALITAGLIKFGSKVNLTDDVCVSVLPLIVGLPDEQEHEINSSLTYQNILFKKVLITLHFKKPLLDKSNPDNPVLVWSKKIII